MSVCECVLCVQCVASKNAVCFLYCYGVAACVVHRFEVLVFRSVFVLLSCSGRVGVWFELPLVLLFFRPCGAGRWCSVAHRVSVDSSWCCVRVGLPSINATLTTLDLSLNQIGDAGAAAIGQGLRCAGVEVIG